jgi:phage-related tail fiber protein
MPVTYYTILTNLGLTRLAEAQATSTPLVFTHLAVGDGNGSPITPDAAMTALVHEVARVTVNNVEISPDEPTTVRVEGLIPSGTGGFTIREAGLFNLAGEMIAIASTPDIYKPTPSEGATVDEYIRILIQYSAVTAIALTIDPDVITATRLYVDDRTGGGLYLWETFT